MKRILSAVLAVILAASAIGCLAGCEKKQITLILRMPPLAATSTDDPEVTEIDQMFEKATKAFSEQYDAADVTFKMEKFEYLKETEAIVGTFDTENATDILYEGYFNMGTYIHTGRVVPLDDIISDEMRNDVDESIWNMSKIDGKTYMMPYNCLQNVLGYNKDLFRQCGLEKYISDEPITNWTVEQWEDILDTLAEKLPENCYPMMMYAKNDQGDTHIMTLLRSHGSNFFDENGNFNLQTDEGIAALKWIQDGCDRGWFPPQSERLEILDNTELFVAGQLAILLTNNTQFAYYEDIDFGCVNFPAANESGIATTFATGFEVFDNGDEDKVEAAKAFVKFVSETDQWAEYSLSGIPARNSICDEHANDIFMLSAFKDNRSNLVDFTNNNPNWRGVREVFYPHMQDLLTKAKTPEQVAAEIDTDCNAAIAEGRASSTLHQ